MHVWSSIDKSMKVLKRVNAMEKKFLCRRIDDLTFAAMIEF